MKKMLITGHRGFLGSKLLQKYGERNFVTVFDLQDGMDAREFFRTNDTKFDLVFHCAAVIGGRKGIEGSPLGVAVDLSIDAEYFQWIERTQPAHAVYFSSSAAYPVRFQTKEFVEDIMLSGGTDLHEDDIELDSIENPDFTYGWAKLTGEYLAQFVTKTRMHIFRPFSGYGETQSLDYPFPSFIARAKRREDPFQIWGDGEQMRDFIHVDDIVNAVDAAIDQDVEGPVNLGWGRSTSFNELARLVTDQAGYTPTFEHLTAEPVGCYRRVSDNSKLLTFYQPKISLEAGIRKALEH